MLFNAPRTDKGDRLASLRDLEVLDTPPEGHFDALVRALALACNVPLAGLTLIDQDHTFIKVSSGSPDHADALRSLADRRDPPPGEAMIEVADTTEDPSLAAHPAVTGAPHVRFYAGVPLRLGDRRAVATLALVDQRPRRLDEAQRGTLRHLATAATQMLENRRILRLQQQASRDLRAHEERLRRLYEASPAMPHTMDENFILLTISDIWLAKLGYRRDEVLGRPATDFMTAESRNRAVAEVAPQLAAAGSITDIDYQLVCKDGSILDVMVSGVLDRGADGGRAVSLMVMEDVTLRRRAERALATEHRRLANILDSTGMGTWEWNVQTAALRINECWASMLGWTTAELGPLSDRTWRDMIHPDDAPHVTAHREQHLSGEVNDYDSDFRVRHRDGRWVWMHERGAIVTRTADGRPEWMFGIRRDITLRKRQDEALAKSEEFLDRTGRAAGVGGWELDLLTSELYWSAETYRIIGAPPENQPTLPAMIGMYAPHAQPVIRGAIDHSIATGEGFDLELAFIRRDGRQIWVRAVAVAAIVDGRPVRLSGAFQDITERVTRQAALQEANERFTLATTAGGIGVWDRDMVTRKLVWDDRMYQLYDLPPGDPAAAEDWRERLHPEDRAATEQVLAEAIAGMRPYVVEFRVVWRDGSIRHLRSAARITRDATGRPVRMAGVNWDVTESHQLAALLRRQAEQQAEAFERENAVFRNSRDLLSIIQVEKVDGRTAFRYEAVNPALLEMTGWRPEDVIGRRPEECLPPDHAPVMHRHYLACVLQGSSLAYQQSVMTAKGRRDFEGHLTPIRHPGSGKIVRLASSVRDVTESRSERLALERANERVTLATECAGLGIWDWNVEAGSIVWDASMYALYGETPDTGEATYDLWQRRLHPDDAAATEAALRAGLDGTRPFDTEFRIVWEDGSVHHLRAKASVIWDAANGETHMVGVNWDVTEARLLAAERDRQSARLAESEAQYRLLADNSSDMIFLLDLQLTRRYVSPACRELLGLEQHDMVGRATGSLFHPEDADRVMARYREVASGTGSGRGGDVGRIRHRDGHYLWVEIGLRLVRDPATGAPLEICGVLRDISERVAAEATLAANNARLESLARHLAVARDAAEQANAAKSRFLTGITHELRTPLNGILGYAQLLRLEGGLTPLQATRVETMLDAGGHLLGMINAVLELSQIDADRIELQCAEIDLVALIQSCLDVIRPAAEARGLEVGLLVVASAPKRLVTDPTRLRQILVNLLGNAAKFTHAGRIDLRLRPGKTASSVRIEVVDTGPGIPQADRARLFREFERLQADAQAPVEGSGLGLAITARLTQRMGGQIGHADNPGGGSVFWIDLPLRAEASEPATQSGEHAVDITPTTGLRILVVDDVAMNLDIAAAFLRLGGHDVVCVDNGPAAIAAVSAEAFDVVLMDVRMPGMDGLETTRRIRGLPAPAASVPIVAMTAQAFAEQIEKCRAAGMDSHVSKPVQQPTLLAAVAAYAGRRAPTPAPPAPDPEPTIPDLDEATYLATAAVLRPEDLELYLRALIDRGHALLARLRAPGMRAEALALADFAHSLGGSGSMFGLQRLATAARQFEHAVETTPAEIATTAEQLAAATAPAVAILQDLVDAMAENPS
jgi:PAS domain S-box-containing protein